MLTKMIFNNLSFECFLDLYRTIENDETFRKYVQIRYSGIFNYVTRCEIEIDTDVIEDCVECRNIIFGVLERHT